LLADLCASMGTDRTAAYMGLAMMLGMGRPAPTDDPEQSEAAMREIVRTIAEQLGDGPAGDLVRALMRIEDQPPHEVLRVLRGVYHALPDRLPDDPATVLCFSFFSTMLLGLEVEDLRRNQLADADRDGLKRLALKFLRVTDRMDGLDSALLNQVALLRYSMLNTLAEIYEQRLDKDPDVTRQREVARHEGVAQADITALLGRVRTQLVAEVRRDASPFTTSFIDAMLRARELSIMREIFGNAPGESDMTTILHDAVDSAQTEVDLQTIAFVVQMLGTTAQFIDGAAEPEAAAKVRKMTSTLETKLKQKHLRASERGLDWSGWDSVLADEEESPEDAAASAASGRSPSRGLWGQLGAIPLWVWVAAWSGTMVVGSAFVLGVVALFVRSRQGKSGQRRSAPDQGPPSVNAAA
jgi:hypothetical protein